MIVTLKGGGKEGKLAPIKGSLGVEHPNLA